MTTTDSPETDLLVSTQGAALVVPNQALCGRDKEVTFQTLPTWFFAAAKRWLRIPTVPGRRHLVTTVTAAGMTLRDAVQGEPSATIQVTREEQEISVRRQTGKSGVQFVAGIAPGMQVSNGGKANHESILPWESESGNTRRHLTPR